MTGQTRHEIHMDIASTQVDNKARLMDLARTHLPERPGNLGSLFVAALNILTPEMELVYRFALRDGPAFNEALQYALERHKKYWGTKKLRLDARGFLAWGPLALAALAHDEGIQIEVESDYLPERLYTR